MPAEWEPHAATWLTWPKNRTTWPGRLLKEVESVYIQMIRALLPGEKVNLLVDDARTTRAVLKKLNPKKAKTQNLIFHKVNVVDTWIRDYGPIFVKPKAFTKWIFNAWGGKYSDLARDNNVVDRVAALRGYPRLDTGIVLEGGSIDVNGLGTCLTTEQCLLDPRRNPRLSKKDIERYLAHTLGVKKLIWLKRGLEGDDTDGHVDDIARFVDERTVLTTTEPDQSDKNHGILRKNLEILKSSTDQDGKRLRVIELPMPGKVGPARTDMSHTRLPASYANFYIANGVVLAPVYSHPNDRLAVKIIKDVFPGRRIVPIECTALVYGLGAIHCVTQQEPI